MKTLGPANGQNGPQHTSLLLSLSVSLKDNLKTYSLFVVEVKYYL